MRFSSLFLMLIMVPVALRGGDLFSLSDAQIVIIGEQHDNPHHHARQAVLTEQIAPQALVFEMLTQAQADRVTPDVRGDEDALQAVLDWNASGWPDFGMYYPIFAAAPQATVFGAAIPREVVAETDETTLAQAFAGDAARYGLDQPLSVSEQTSRNALQKRAHCDALPDSLLPRMVAIQRLRDAELARVALEALSQTGGPVVVITGNGHARKDWGVPSYLDRVAPDVTVLSIGQGEQGSGVPDGGFDLTEITLPFDRGDPCAAFR